ncbi:Pentapeptide repeats (8 copies) [Posidoniimonas corsicana]|uniref:Pentapeptide repeats (8 copies) n=1 Tax=Posidoniimonas corsicana TaxID=1938618 RepID=A0A5C5VIC1_9BACT|nr:pentapeptide repeat-containing protein [Posidoniimonas corsicana]TWT37650.1 Pentapeptide repeats (8 copies) [Posidoniimonas corsicana]
MASEQVKDFFENIDQHVASLSVDVANPYGNHARALAEFRRGFPGLSDFTNLRIESLDFREADFDDLVLSGTKFINCDLTGATFRNATLVESWIYPTWGPGGHPLPSVRHANFRDADLHGARLKGDLTSAEFTNANLTWVYFDDSSLRSAEFTGAILDHASLCNVDVDPSTTFEFLRSCDECKADRNFLNTLGPQMGSLTLGNLSAMAISDPVYELRYRFGGVWRTIHLLSVAVFLWPYIWFVGSKWAGAKFKDQPGDDSMTLLEALLRFIVTGGKNWQASWQPNYLSLGCFAVVLLFNLIRVVLLRKTLELEEREKITGIPPRFSLSSKFFRNITWENLLLLMHILWFAMMASVVINTSHFMMQRISVPVPVP